MRSESPVQLSQSLMRYDLTFCHRGNQQEPSNQHFGFPFQIFMKSNQLHQGVILISQYNESQRSSAKRGRGDVTVSL